MRIPRFGAATMALLLVACLPHRAVDTERIRLFIRPLVIETTKSNPPRIAFDEVLRSDSSLVKDASAIRETINLAVVIAKKQLRPFVSSVNYRIVNLAPMSIGRVETQEILRNPIALSTAGEDWKSQLSSRERQILDNAQLNDEELNFPDFPDPLQKSLREKVRAELTGANAHVGAQYAMTSATQNRVIETAPPSQKSALANELAPEQLTKKPTGPFLVEGIVRIDHRSVLGPGRNLAIHWLREGRSERVGKISIQDAKFSIEVAELIGKVEVQLSDDVSGQVIAKGGIQLHPRMAHRELRGAKIELQPAHGFSGSFNSFYDEGTKTKSRGRKISTQAAFDEETTFAPTAMGHLFVEGVAARSTSLALSRSDNFYPTLHLLKSGKTQLTTMLPAKLVKAWQETITDLKIETPVEMTGSVVLGRVGGSARQGYRVEIRGLPYKAIYLNELYIPDPRLTETSSVGAFLFVDLPAGFYTANASKVDPISEQFLLENFAVEPNAATVIELTGKSTPVSFEVRTFHAFDGTPLAGELFAQGLENSNREQNEAQKLMSEGLLTLDSYLAHDLALAWFRPREDRFLSAIYPFDPEQSFAHLPVVDRDWLAQARAAMQIDRFNPSPDFGVIIGFVPSGAYDVGLTPSNLVGEARVSYFNSQGQLVPTAQEGGGFIIFNVTEAAHTLVIRHFNGETQTQVVPVEANQTTIARFAF